MKSDEEKINDLAQTLYSKGLTASLWDAKNKARDILGLAKPAASSSWFNSTQEKAVDDIMGSLGVKVEAVRKAEQEKLEQIKKEVKIRFDEEDKKESTVSALEISELKQDSIAEFTVSLPKSEILENAEPVEIEQPKEAPKADVVYFSDSVEGAAADTPVHELVDSDISIEPAEELMQEESEDIVQEAEQSHIGENSDEIDISSESNESQENIDIEIEGQTESLDMQHESNVQIEQKEIVNTLLKSTIEEPTTDTVPLDKVMQNRENTHMDNSEYLDLNQNENNDGNIVDELKAEEIPKIIDDEYKEENSETKIIIEESENVFFEVDKKKLEEEKD
jgi:hypothetical protein